MVINLKELPKYRDAIAELSKEISAGASAERQEELFSNAFNILADELRVKNESELNRLFELKEQNATVTGDEMAFFNEIADNPGVKDPRIIPETLMIRVFEDLKSEHPLLSIIKFKNTGARLKALVAEASGVAQWGPLYGDIKGQLLQKFDEVDFGMNKLTAYVVIPKDALKFSYSWLKSFIIEQIKEAISVALELALVKGTGENQPVGLIKDLSKPSASGKLVTYPTDKKALKSIATITPESAKKDLAPVMQFLSCEKREGKHDKFHKVDGKVCLLVNPSDRWSLEAQLTGLTAGLDLKVVMPFGIKLVESVAIDSGKAIAFVPDRYDAFMASSATIEEFDQTFAIEDLQLYTTKSHYYGKARDNHAAALLTLVGG
ncbi:TPA: phage major capsid protein [Streptococcus suis]|nr:phage major capsid protein [Streptococcus suis]HEM5096211.1 phage major capsid protein [Streptococcus suis]